jgi:hypothetical protein
MVKGKIVHFSVESYIMGLNINIEMVQWRAARYVTNRQRNTSSVGDMLQHLKIGFTTDVVDVAFPFEVLTDSTTSQICFLINRFEDMIMKAIVEFHY